MIRHATLAARQVKPIDPALFLDPDSLRLWDAWAAEHGDASPPPGSSGREDLWPLYIVSRRGR